MEQARMRPVQDMARRK